MRRLDLSTSVVGKTAGFVLVGAAVLATAVHIHAVHGPRSGQGLARAGADPLTSELARCQAIGAAADTDPACNAAWAENRRRFFDGAQATPPRPAAVLAKQAER